MSTEPSPVAAQPADEATTCTHVTLVRPEAVDATDAPPLVKHKYFMFANRLHRFKGADIRLSRTPRGGWVIGLYIDGDGMEIGYSKHHGKWRPRRHRPVRLIINNTDYSDEIKSIDEALKKLMGAIGQPKSPGQIGRIGGVEGTPTSVQVRNTTVIRN